MRLVIGIVIGLLLGSVTSALAYYERSGELLADVPLFRQGYVTGAADMLELVVIGLNDSVTRETAPSRFAQTSLCLRAHGETLGALTAYAEYLWQSNSDQIGASALFTCALR